MAAKNRDVVTTSIQCPTLGAMENTIRTITATPAGRDRFGQPLKPRTYKIDRDPEDWGNGRSRIFAENRTLPALRANDPWTNGQPYHFTPQVVRTDSIKEA